MNLIYIKPGNALWWGTPAHFLEPLQSAQRLLPTLRGCFAIVLVRTNLSIIQKGTKESSSYSGLLVVHLPAAFSRGGTEDHCAGGPPVRQDLTRERALPLVVRTDFWSRPSSETRRGTEKSLARVLLHDLLAERRSALWSSEVASAVIVIDVLSLRPPAVHGL